MIRRVIGASALLFIILSFVLYRAVPTERSCFDIDSMGYHRIATEFYSTGVLCDPLTPDQAPVQTVGYHFFVGVIYKLFGQSTLPIIMVQIFLALLSLWLTFLIGRFFFDDRVAVLAVFLCAVNVGFLVYPQFLLAETVLLTLVLMFVERFLSFFKTGRMSSLVVAGLIGGISLLIKPSMLLFLPVVVLFLLFFPLVRRRRMLTALMFICAFLLPFGGYLTYNKVHYGYFNLAPMKSLNMYYVFLSKVIARVHNIPISQAEQQIPPFSSTNSLDERGWEGARILFWQYVKSYPMTCIVVWTENVAKTVCGLYSTQLKLLLNPVLVGGDVSFFKEQGSWLSRAYQYVVRGSTSGVVIAIALFEAVFSILRYLLVLIALCVLLYRRRYATVLFFLAFIIVGVGITGFDGCCRYRILVEPFLLILSSLSVIFLYDKVKGRTSMMLRQIW